MRTLLGLGSGVSDAEVVAAYAAYLAGDVDSNPATLAVTVEEAKLHARITDSSEDALIERYIRAAQQWVERYTGLGLGRRTVVQEFDRWGLHLDLLVRPVVSVESVTHTDAEGVEQDLTDFVLRPSAARVYTHGAWPSSGRNGQVTVSYTAGYLAGAEPECLVQAIHILVTAWFESRTPDQIPGAAIALCEGFRMPGV